MIATQREKSMKSALIEEGQRVRAADPSPPQLLSHKWEKGAGQQATCAALTERAWVCPPSSRLRERVARDQTSELQARLPLRAG
jgi:hypothetical protein